MTDRLALLSERAQELEAAVRAGDLPRMWNVAERISAIIDAASSLTAVEIASLTQLISRTELAFGTARDLVPALVEAAERSVPLDATAVTALTMLRQTASLTSTAQLRKVAERLDALLGKPASPLDPGAPYADEMMRALSAMPAPERAPWDELLEHASRADGSKPTARWSKTAAAIVGRIGRARFLERMTAFLSLVEKPKSVQQVGWSYAAPISDRNTRVLVGCAWAIGHEATEAHAAQLLGDLGALCLTKIPSYGAVSNRVGNACVTALGMMSGLHGVAQLSRLKLRVKYTVAQRLIGRALDAAAEKNGITVDDLEDLAVPTFGLASDGSSSLNIGDWQAHLQVGRGVEVTWTHPSKRAPKSVPSEVKSDPLWKQTKKTIAEIEQRLATERVRLERFYLARREIPLDAFRARFLDHPVVSSFARRLVWNVSEGASVRPALVRRGRFVDLESQPITNPDARVSLFHPLGYDRDALAVLQDVLEDEAIVQPWKQVHREIYAVAVGEDAAREDGRFGGHVVRQHAFASLLQARGWRFRLMGAFDSHNTPELSLPTWGLTAAIDVDFPSEEGDQTSGSGIYLHIRVGALHFTRDGLPITLGEVPPLLFSEIMRDVDLFCSVTSIASDPQWFSRREENAFTRYWQAHAFGPLPASAAVRSEVLRKILARVPLADRFEIEGRFLRVRGTLRRYRIHLGTGHVLIDPIEQPLVLGEVPSAGLALPFEGDDRLERILDTAMVLAEDERHQRQFGDP